MEEEKKAAETVDVAALQKQLTEMQAAKERSDGEARKAFEKRDALAAKLKDFDEKTKDLETQKLLETGELKAAFDALGQKHESTQTEFKRYSDFVAKQIEQIAPKVPKEILAKIPEGIGTLEKLDLVSSLAAGFEQVNTTPAPAAAPSSSGAKTYADMSPEEQKEYRKKLTYHETLALIREG